MTEKHPIHFALPSNMTVSHYYLSDFHEVNEPGLCYTHLALDGVNGRQIGWCRPGLCRIWPDKPGQIVRVSYVESSWNGQPYMEVYRCEPLAPHSEFSLDWLPKAWAPPGMEAWVKELWAVIWMIEQPDLVSLLSTVFADPAIGPAYMRTYGSRHHHHAYPGGLLVHSVQTARRARRMCQGDNQLSPYEHLAVTAALLHDIGKLRTVGDGARRPEIGFRVCHNALTLEMLHPHLARLDRNNQVLADALREIWTWKWTKDHPYPPFLATQIVRDADRQDVAVAMNRWAFTGQPAHWTYAKTPAGTLHRRLAVQPTASAIEQRA